MLDIKLQNLEHKILIRINLNLGIEFVFHLPLSFQTLHFHSHVDLSVYEFHSKNCYTSKST